MTKLNMGFGKMEGKLNHLVNKKLLIFKMELKITENTSLKKKIKKVKI